MSQVPAIGLTHEAYGAEGTVRRIATIEACDQANVQCVPLPFEPDEPAQALKGLGGQIFEDVLGIKDDLASWHPPKHRPT